MELLELLVQVLLIVLYMTTDHTLNLRFHTAQVVPSLLMFQLDLLDLLDLLVKVLVILVKMTTDHTFKFILMGLTEAVASLLIFQLELQG